MNISALKTELLNTLTNSANLTAGEKTKLRDRCVLRFPEDFARYLAENSLTDNATNRGKFFIEKTVGNALGGISGYWSLIWIEGNQREREAAMPAVDPFV